METTFADSQGRHLAVIRRDETSTLVFGLVVLPPMPYGKSVERDIIYDLNRATLESLRETLRASS